MGIGFDERDEIVRGSCTGGQTDLRHHLVANTTIDTICTKKTHCPRYISSIVEGCEPKKVSGVAKVLASSRWANMRLRLSSREMHVDTALR